MIRTALHGCVFSLCLFFAVGCEEDSPPPEPLVTGTAPVTFYEIGSDHCEPCKMMRPIMESLQTKYGDAQLSVIFLDVIKDKAEADRFEIRVIPTQVFLDDEGNEFHRHEGFYPEAEIDSLLQHRGLQVLPG